MAAIAGKGGKVVNDSNDVANIASWDLDISVDMQDVTALGDSWKENISGLKEWSASAEGHWDVASDTNGQTAFQTSFLAGTAVTLKLYVNSTNYYSGSAFISNMSVSDPVDGKVDVSFEFTGNGALSYT